MKKDVQFYKRLNKVLIGETWYHGEISCEEAEARLALAEKVGSFLVRNVGRIYMFSFVGTKSGFKHVKVPTTRKASVLKEKLVEPSILESEYQVIKHILNMGCKYFLYPVDRPKHMLLGNLVSSKVEDDNEEV